MENTKGNQTVGSEEVSSRWPSVMVDIETLSTRADAVVLEIGAVCFDLERRTMGPRMLEVITLSSNVAAGRVIDADTLNWWLDQFRERGEVADWEKGRETIGEAIFRFREFWSRHAQVGARFWSRGNLDVSVMDHVLQDFDVFDTPVPWKYWDVRDQRSILDWEGIRRPTEVAHGALDDAYSQVLGLFAAADRRDGRVKMPDPDFAVGWAEYREGLATTQAALIPVWEQLPGEVREAFAAGVRAALKGGAR